ncbi:23270_t:CDS:2 [Dentiscutata erythropus]|uniref:23270_t:CDS:1 n=1 Tax=Dentiscutata erythropus TaxID=1348616 RepID=A0A9N9AF86_9GLOM|nr:23270_t:CDS:2 [Dentiscutata erythropus]
MSHFDSELERINKRCITLLVISSGFKKTNLKFGELIQDSKIPSRLG